ncbi:hypothetical protein ACPCHQ_17045 [Ralstonia thomasii]|uniref:HAD family hydrolase n=2 Tax=Ralstonia TaxID=48736 RepID=A0ABN9JEZ6_9RALS|nr:MULTISPECIES: hypothetical protein [Ralstonia]MBT2181017.1 hypothetical protein [Ralstonia pickettii]CAJ0710699.1 hypothetical protein LMG7143_01693 [Ralstonia sp. LMG 18095]CAJ0806267.1 hypothetical protein LMG18095_04412 [Ralstonia sp. LMG 18095]
MIVGLDYDGTCTKAPAIWDRFIADCTEAGHTVVCITMRTPDEAVEMPCEVIYTARKAKIPHLNSLSRRVDIWIDDAPHWLFQDAL